MNIMFSFNLKLYHQNFNRSYLNGSIRLPVNERELALSNNLYYSDASTNNISETMYTVGYNDSKAFRNIFKKYTGLSPAHYRSKYNREMAMA
jgi:YesN/AraC family two-component response regulator